MLHFRAVIVGIVVLLQQQIPPVAPLPPQPFDEWLGGVRAEALTRGIRETTIEQAFAGLEPLPIVVERDRTQAELVLTLDRYLRQHLTKRVIDTAAAMRRSHAGVLTKVQQKYGVPAEIVIAIWGLESNFGRFSGVRPTIQTLATLAYDPRRSTMFREELFDALKILDSGDVEPTKMRGSWAGALGQPQFMPSSFLLYAQDFDGDGKRDIWRSVPDVFASIANFLAAKGWTASGRWGREVTVPASLLARLPEVAPLQTEGCLAKRQMSVPLPVETWQKLGIRAVSGAALPTADHDVEAASLISGVKRHFLVYPNYRAVLEYNCVNAYGLSVGLLADRSIRSTPPKKSTTHANTKTHR
ncbi:MAG TPA: lytic murein transglycosylase [Vicinamibacterales bacterium]|nr:lytic murein transglycosylase [Vicinamibacterales bacterium]